MSNEFESGFENKSCSAQLSSVPVQLPAVVVVVVPVQVDKTKLAVLANKWFSVKAIQAVFALFCHSATKWSTIQADW